MSLAGLMVHVFNLSTKKAEAGEFEASLVNIRVLGQ